MMNDDLHADGKLIGGFNMEGIKYYQNLSNKLMNEEKFSTATY